MSFLLLCFTTCQMSFDFARPWYYLILWQRSISVLGYSLYYSKLIRLSCSTSPRRSFPIQPCIDAYESRYSQQLSLLLEVSCQIPSFFSPLICYHVDPKYDLAHCFSITTCSEYIGCFVRKCFFYSVLTRHPSSYSLTRSFSQLKQTTCKTSFLHLISRSCQSLVFTQES